ncbi:hypothetical protein BAY61_11725 [Prauserella marina]|uniref:Uncharacterized protein n=1 Tax=Prauserella marina TaxID=530584 RepID=A0A222VP65_9PSEU|nr:hypothetical protein [Prauserella marina]ASR35553.1 hypothetical protein BAY61_11725 [Prauserella marina]PWV84603.1 hypothetical protein DES30_101620 [Prauserella marina]SDC17969.1 hypothetical protein SAMN05421630_101716 [Prauserella marina]
MRHHDRNQLDLFTTTTTTTPASTRDTPPAKGRRSRTVSASPTVAQDVLAEIQAGRFGLLDDSDRVVVIDGDGHVRTALDEDVVHELIQGRYAQPCPARDTITALHGAIRKPVSPLRLTKTGRALLHRWSALHTYP